MSGKVYQLARVCVEPILQGRKVSEAIVNTDDYFWFTEAGNCIWRDVEDFTLYSEDPNDTTCKITRNMYRVWVEAINETYGNSEFNPIQEAIDEDSMEDTFWDVGHNGKLMDFVFQAAELQNLREDMMEFEISFGFFLLCEVVIDEVLDGYGDTKWAFDIKPLFVLDLEQIVQKHKTEDTPSAS